MRCQASDGLSHFPGRRCRARHKNARKQAGRPGMIDSDLAVDDYPGNASRVLVRLVESCRVPNGGRVEHHQIGPGALGNYAAVGQPEARGRQCGHAAQGFGQRKYPHVARVAAKDARTGSVVARMRMAFPELHAPSVGCHCRERAEHETADILLGNVMEYAVYRGLVGIILHHVQDGVRDIIGLGRSPAKISPFTIFKSNMATRLLPAFARTLPGVHMGCSLNVCAHGVKEKHSCAVMGQLRSGEDGEVRADESVRTKRFGLLL